MYRQFCYESYRDINILQVWKVGGMVGERRKTDCFSHPFYSSEGRDLLTEDFACLTGMNGKRSQTGSYLWCLWERDWFLATINGENLAVMSSHFQTLHCCKQLINRCIKTWDWNCLHGILSMSFTVTFSWTCGHFVFLLYLLPL